MTEEQVVNVRGEDGNSVNVKVNGVFNGVGVLDLENGEKPNGTEINLKDGAAEKEGSETATVDEIKCADSRNGAGSVQNAVVENGDESVNAVTEELVTDHDCDNEDYVVVGASDVQNGVAAENEVGGDVNVNVNRVVEGDVDVNRSDCEFEGLDVHNDVVVVTASNENSEDDDMQGRSESLSGKDVDKSGERENVVNADVSDEDIVTIKNHDVEEVVEKNEVPVDLDDVKECEHEDSRNSLEKGQVEPVSGVGAGVQNGFAEPEPEPSESTKVNEIAVDDESVSKLERSEEEVGTELVPGENLVALDSTDVIGDGDVMFDIAVESIGKPSNGVVQSESKPAVLSEIKNTVVETEGELSNDAVEGEGQLSNVAISNGAVESEVEPSSSAVESEVETSDVAEPSNGAVETEAEPSNGAVETEAEPSNGAVETEAEPSNGAVETEAEPSNGAVETEAEPTSVESEAEPTSVKTEAEPTSVETDAEPTSVETDAEPTSVEAEAEPTSVEAEAEPTSVETEAEPTTVETEAEPTTVETEAEPSNGTVETEAEPTSVETEAEPTSLETEAEPSMETEAEPSNGAPNAAVETEPLNAAVVSEAEPTSLETEAEPSMETEAEPSNGAPNAAVETEPLNAAVVSEAEPLNAAVVSEAEPSSNGTVDDETVLSVEVCESKNNAVESETLPSVEVSEKKTEPSFEGEDSNLGDEVSRPALDALDDQNVSSEVVKKPFYYLIRVPRYDDDENLKEHIKIALNQVEEKTKIRDSIRAESQTIKASCKECDQEFKAAIAAGRAARDLLKSKRQEMDSVQSTMNRLNNAISVGDIDGKIRNMEHMIQHETLPLNEEKQLIRQIKQLKQNREELSSNMRKQDQLQQSLDQKDNIEEQFKRLQLLKKEMEVLRNNVQKSEATTKAAKKKYTDECDKLNELLTRFKTADDIRQEAYAKLHSLKKQLHEKNKTFWEYKNAAHKAHELAAGGKKEELQCFCVDQVERIMELWNKNDVFRKDYVRCNTRSTLRRLQTLDGRSLGPDEEPPVIPSFITERALKNKDEQETKSTPIESVKTKDEPPSKVDVQRTETNQTSKAKKPTKPVPLEKPVARWGDESDEDQDKKEPVRTKEEEEHRLKAEKARKEEEEAKLKEKRRIEEIEKAKEALQRKKRNAEKAQQRAALKAQKEAEQKEKEREKRAKKKERRKAASNALTLEDTEQEQESAPILETLTRSMQDSDESEKPAEITKKPQKPSQFTRQAKAKSVPLALRNRGKRRIQPWMWVIIAVMVVVALFFVGNSSALRSSIFV